MKSWNMHMQMHKSKHLAFLSLSLTCNLNFCTWSPGSGWLLPFLGNSLLFRIELIPIRDCWDYFP